MVIMEIILEICKEPTSKTRIVNQAKLNLKNADNYLSPLIRIGALEVLGKSLIRYKTTPKGLKLLEHIKEYNALRSNKK
jgi:predicted transcriptional regulator